MVYIIPDFLVLHLGENFMKIRTKIAKLQIYENLHKNVNENMFSFTFLCKWNGHLKQQMLYTANFDMLFNQFKSAVQFHCIKFFQFWWSKCFLPNSIGPDFRKVGKSLNCIFLKFSYVYHNVLTLQKIQKNLQILDWKKIFTKNFHIKLKLNTTLIWM